MRSPVESPERLIRAAPNPADEDRAPLLSREGEYWTIIYDGLLLRLRDTKGLYYLAQLLQCPGERLPAAALLRSVRAHGPAGQGDSAPADEPARLAVTKCIKASIAKIAGHHPGLGFHLRMCIKTGHACSYLPDPVRAIPWTVRITARSTQE